MIISHYHEDFQITILGKLIINYELKSLEKNKYIRKIVFLIVFTVNA